MGKVLKVPGRVIHVLLSDAVHRSCRKKCFSSSLRILPVAIMGWLRPGEEAIALTATYKCV